MNKLWLREPGQLAHGDAALPFPPALWCVFPWPGVEVSLSPRLSWAGGGQGYRQHRQRVGEEELMMGAGPARLPREQQLPALPEGCPAGSVRLWSWPGCGTLAPGGV